MAFSLLPYGMSITQIFSSAFKGVERLHGASTGPMGSVAGPLLQRSLKGTSAESLFRDGPDTQRLKQVFAGTSYRIINPATEIDETYRSLSCKMLSQNANDNQEAVRVLSQKTNLKKYYEPLLEVAPNSQFLSALRNTVSASYDLRSQFQSFFAESDKQHPFLENEISILGFADDVRNFIFFHKTGLATVLDSPAPVFRFEFYCDRPVLRDERSIARNTAARCIDKNVAASRRISSSPQSTLRYL